MPLTRTILGFPDMDAVRSVLGQTHGPNPVFVYGDTDSIF